MSPSQPALKATAACRTVVKMAQFVLFSVGLGFNRLSRGAWCRAMAWSRAKLLRMLVHRVLSASQSGRGSQTVASSSKTCRSPICRCGNLLLWAVERRRVSALCERDSSERRRCRLPRLAVVSSLSVVKSPGSTSTTILSGPSPIRGLTSAMTSRSEVTRSHALSKTANTRASNNCRSSCSHTDRLME